MRSATNGINKMRILIDTSILFSALVFPQSKPAQALLYIAKHPEYCRITKCALYPPAFRHGDIRRIW